MSRKTRSRYIRRVRCTVRARRARARLPFGPLAAALADVLRQAGRQQGHFDRLAAQLAALFREHEIAPGIAYVPSLSGLRELPGGEHQVVIVGRRTEGESCSVEADEATRQHRPGAGA